MSAPTSRNGAVIFDMDGLLIDSEPLWRRAQRKTFLALGLHLTESDCESTTGLRIDEVAHHWFRRRPWPGPTPDEVAEQIVNQMIALVASEGRALPGAKEAVAHASKRAPTALASSSPHRLIDATLERLGLTFDLIVSAEKERFGKPHPAVFLTTATKLGIEATRCVVFEDSLNGVLAAKSARMTCIAVPDPTSAGDPRFAIADLRLSSLREADDAFFDGLALSEG